jgi:hypothetical protein
MIQMPALIWIKAPRTTRFSDNGELSNRVDIRVPGSLSSRWHPVALIIPSWELA